MSEILHSNDDNSIEDNVTEESSPNNIEEIESLKKEIAALRDENESLSIRLKRAQADFQNLKRRSESEKGALIKFALEDFIIKLLPVVDNLERAIKVEKADTDVSDLLEGVTLVYKQLYDILKKEGVLPIDAVGQPLDPFKHEAMNREETDKYPDGFVMEEFLKGYELNEKVIRHSLVKVAKAKEL